VISRITLPSPTARTIALSFLTVVYRVQYTQPKKLYSTLDELFSRKTPANLLAPQICFPFCSFLQRQDHNFFLNVLNLPPLPSLHTLRRIPPTKHRIHFIFITLPLPLILQKSLPHPFQRALCNPALYIYRRPTPGTGKMRNAKCGSAKFADR
jgi:hypothetical protein